ncbi:MAG: phosphoglucosamine mutase [Thermoplasmata archaeon]
MSLFGTNGIRGILNETLDPELGFKLGMAVATFYDGESVAVGYDSRTSYDLLSNIVSAGIMNSGKNVIKLGLIPTPGIQIYCRINSIPGIMITASHNPPEFNGLKVIGTDGAHPSKEEEAKLENIITNEHFMRTTWDFVGKSRYDDAVAPYVRAVLSNVSPNSIAKKRFRVAADCANSTTLATTPVLLRSLQTHYLTLNANADGFFPGRNPEPTEENLKDLIIAAKNGGFDLSVAHDGDGDRAVYLDEKGNFIDGDKVVALIADHILEREKGDIVVPISSSFLIDVIAEKHGVKVIRTRVGAPVVSETLTKMKALFGGEENGGVIYPKHLNARDGAYSLAMMLDIMSYTDEPISSLIKKLPDYKIRRIKLPLKGNFETIVDRANDIYRKYKIDNIDGFRAVDRDSFILIRKSGTEPIMRIYISSKDDEWLNAREKEIRSIIS